MMELRYEYDKTSVNKVICFATLWASKWTADESRLLLA